MPVRVVEGVVQHYAWGDHEFIPALLGVASRNQPWAELWLGTHPNGPTMLDDGTPLSELTGALPYLLKVLSAAEPLSLQAHPTPEQARLGFERGVFRDPSAKPELLVALTEFEALCGVRPEPATIDLLRGVGADGLADVVAADGAGSALHGLYRGEIDPSAAIEACRHAPHPEAGWVRRLDDRYPGEPSVAATLLLNYVTLRPGEALHLTAGTLHAYLQGSGIELMAASDNVVRGGLTVKPVDIDLLLDVLDPTPLVQPVMSVTDGRYPLPEAGVTLVHLGPGCDHTSTGHELAIAMDGTTLYLSPGSPIYTTTDTYIVVTTPP
jgi:mannose-6-phosphate isomerase